MTMDAFHPEQLQPGQRVGPWRIVERLGSGGSACVFKVEREGVFFAMKMALRPVSEDDAEEAAAMRWGYEAGPSHLRTAPSFAAGACGGLLAPAAPGLPLSHP